MEGSASPAGTVNNCAVAGLVFQHESEWGMDSVKEGCVESDMCGNCGWWRAKPEPSGKARFGECDGPHVGQSTVQVEAKTGGGSLRVDVTQPITCSGTYCLHHRRVNK